MATLTPFLEVQVKPGTMKVYRGSLKRFFAYIYKTDVPFSAMEQYADRYIDDVRKGSRNSKHDLMAFTASMGTAIAPTTKNTRLSSVVSWLQFHDLEFTPGQRKEIGRKAGAAIPVSRDRIPSQDELRRIVEVSPFQLKALIYVLSSTGMRLGEALQIELKHLILNEDPARIEIAAQFTKTGRPRTVYLSDEAKKIMEQWVGGYRDRYGKTIKHKDLLKPDDMRVFPYSDTNATRMFYTALEKANLLDKDITTGRNLIHIHALRKYFRTNLVKAGGNAQDVTEYIMGHSGYLTMSYVRLTPEEVRDFYKENQHHLWINTPIAVNTEEIKNLQEENKVLQERLKALETQIQTLTIIGQVARVQPDIDIIAARVAEKLAK